MRKRNVLIFTLTITSILGCKIKIPSTEKECLMDSKKIIKYVKKSEYNDLADYIHKYREYQNYSKDDLEKEFNLLQKALISIDVNRLQCKIKKDTIHIDYEKNKSEIISINLNYFNTDKSNLEVPVCEFRYTQEPYAKYYQLISFDHNYRVKIKPVLPKH